MKQESWLKPLVWIACGLPAAWLAGLIVLNDLGANPVERVIHFTGDWALRLLVGGLALSPLARLTDWTWPIRIRRMVGLFAFFYASLHLASWGVLDRELELAAILEDLGKRTYITAGMAAYLILCALAATSTRAAQRRMGRNWKRLHRLVYVAATLGVIHFLWLVKVDLREPGLYAALLTVLLGARVWIARWRR